MPQPSEAVVSLLKSLDRTTEETIGRQDLIERLCSGKKLRMKYGVDLTAPLLHIGHAVNLWMYRALQEQGHKVLFLLGDFTTTIGDPTGRSKTRPVLSKEEIEKNANEFLRQVSMVLLQDPEVFEVRRNSEWFAKMSAAELLSILSTVTHDRLISRDMFQRRIAEGASIAMHEMLYPVLQGYDSVMLESDLTIVGSDQLFNEQMGRFFQEKHGQAPQVLMTSVVTPGIDGKEKQSKSLGNYVGLGHSAREKYGRLMSIPDGLIESYLHVYTDISLEKIAQLKPEIESHPMKVKHLLAQSIVARYHGEQAALEEQAWFDSTFSQKNAPADAPVVNIGLERCDLLSALKKCDPSQSNSAWRRLIEQGGVSIEGVKQSDPGAELDIKSCPMMKVGKLKWFQLKP